MAQGDLPTRLDCQAIAREWLNRLQKAADDPEAFRDLLLSDAWLRDLVCFDWDLRTIAGRDKIVSYLSEPLSRKTASPDSDTTRLSHSSLSDVKLQTDSGLGPPTTFPLPLKTPEELGIMACFTFALRHPDRTGRGLVRLAIDPVTKTWKAQTLFLTVEDLVGHEEGSKKRPDGVWDNHSTNWEDIREERRRRVEEDPTVLIVGGGQSGLMCAARMGQMGIRALVVDECPRVGDAWRNRYPNMTLHTPAVHSSILYHPWPKTCPKWLPKDIIADWLEAYVAIQNIVVWLSSTLLSDPHPVYDETKRSWTVHVRRRMKSPEGDAIEEVVTLHPKHLVMCIGNGKTNIPKFKGMENFEGDVHHSDHHKNAKKWAGKKAVVVGACNAAGDTVQSFLSPGHSAASVTMIQRSPTCVMTVNTADRSIFANALETRPVEDNDFISQSMPPRLVLQLATAGVTEKLKKMDEELFDKLREKGFQLTWELEPGKGEVGIVGFVLDRAASGSMIDIGCCQSIVDGKVAVKSKVEIDHFERDAVVLSDGTRIEADVVVLATGNEPMVNAFRRIFDDTTMQKIGSRFFDLDEEGEPTKCFRPTGQNGLWITAGSFQHARFLSKHLAIQILVEELGLKD